MVVSGPPSGRVEIPTKFKERFGISVEWVSGSTRSLAGKIRLEQQSRLSTIDIFLGGSSTVATRCKEKKRPCAGSATS